MDFKYFLWAVILGTIYSCGFLTGGHFGRDKTYDRIASRFYWPEMSGDVREYVATCDICQRTNDGGKFAKATAPLHPIKVEPEVWRMVCVLCIAADNFSLCYSFSIYAIGCTNVLLIFNGLNYSVYVQVGIDLIGPLPETRSGNKYIVTLVDYFSKWPEAQALPDKTAKGVALFLYRMMCR